MLREETHKRLAAHAGADENQLIDALRNIFPNGHPNFLLETLKEMELHSVKNHDYASGGTALGNFDRVSNFLAQYPGLSLADKRVYALVLALKQVDAVLWGLSQKIQHKVEGLDSRLDDIAVYAKIVKCMNADMARVNAELEKSVHDVAAQYGHTAESMAKEAKPYTSAGTTACGPREALLDDLRNVARQIDQKESAIRGGTCPELNQTRDRVSPGEADYGDNINKRCSVERTAKEGSGTLRSADPNRGRDYHHGG